MLSPILLALFPLPQSPLDLAGAARSAFSPGHVQGADVRTDASGAPIEVYLIAGSSILVLDYAALLLPGPGGATDPTVHVEGGSPTGSPFLARVPVEASVQSTLVVDSDATSSADDRLVIAGGDYGLLSMAIGPGQGTGCGCDALGQNPGCYRVERIDDYEDPALMTGDSERWCMDVAVTRVGDEQILAALFHHDAWPELRTYVGDGAGNFAFRERYMLHPGAPAVDEARAWPAADPATYEPVPATAYALAAEDEDVVYVALGTEGILRADLTVGPDHWTRLVLRGDLDADQQSKLSSNDLGFPDYEEHGRVRDVALGRSDLYAAVDKDGVLQIDLATWDQKPPTYHFVSLEDGDYDSYGWHLDAVTERSGEEWIAVVGANEPARQLGHGAPYENFGTWGFDLSVGDAVPGGSNGGQSRTYVLYDKAPGGLPCAMRGSFGGPPLQQGRLVLEDPLGPGTALLRWFLREDVVELDAGPPKVSRTVVADVVPLGYSAFGATPLLHQPDVILLNGETSKLLRPGLIDLRDCSACTPTPIPGTEGVHRGGLNNPRAHWIVDADRERLIRGRGQNDKDDPTDVEGWWLKEIDSGLASCADSTDLGTVRRWYIPSPDVDGTGRGRIYMPSCRQEGSERVLLGRTSQHYGVLMTRIDLIENELALVAACGTAPSGELDPQQACSIFPPMLPIETHPEVRGWTQGDPTTHYYDSADLPDLLVKSHIGGILAFDAVVERGTPAREIALVLSGTHLDDRGTFDDTGPTCLQGFTPDDPDFGKLHMVLVDLERRKVAPGVLDDVEISPEHGKNYESPLRPFAMALGAEPCGGSWSAELLEIFGRRYVVVADLGGRVQLFDLSDDVLCVLYDGYLFDDPGPNTLTPPSEVRALASWILPPHGFDSNPGNVLDVALYPHGDPLEVSVYATAGRSGVAQFELAIAPPPAVNTILLPIEIDGVATTIEVPDHIGFPTSDPAALVNTPGIALYVTYQDLPGGPRILVGDSEWGLGVYE